MISRCKIEKLVKRSHGGSVLTSVENYKINKNNKDYPQIEYVLNENIYPLFFNFKKSIVYFVETRGEINNNQESFFYEPLQQKATHLIAVPFDDLYKLEGRIKTKNDEYLLFIHHPGRCGSTLLHKVMGTHPMIESYSEYLMLENFFINNNMKSDEEKRLLKLLISLIKSNKSDYNKILCFKMTGWSRMFLDRIMMIFPDAKHIYLSRDPVKIAESYFNLFCIYPSYKFIWKLLGVQHLKIHKYEKAFKRINDHGTLEEYYSNGILNTKFKKIRNHSLLERFILRVLLYDLVFKPERLQNLLTLNYEDLIDKPRCFEILRKYLEFDTTMNGFNDSVYHRHSQEGSLAKPKNMKKYYLTKNRYMKLKEFEKYANSLMSVSKLNTNTLDH